jgi:peptidoglycan L-alanyl-D-glutamate endopeptidase CwlK
VTLVHHAERCPNNPALQAFVAWWQVNGPFPIVIVYGDRNDKEQAELYAQGRTKPGKIVTHALRAKDSAHGHSGAIDCMPVRELYPNGGVKLVYLGDEADPVVRAQGRARLKRYVELVKQHGLESGDDFPGLHDGPHAQDPEWASRPLNEGVAP